MDRAFYEEKQKLPRIFGWLVVFVGLAMIFPLAKMLYVQWILQEETGASPARIIFILVLLIVVLGVAVWLTFSFTLEVSVSNGGIEYMYFPQQSKPRQIERREIIGFEVRKIKWKEMIQSRRDRRLGRLTGNQVYSVRGTDVVQVDLTGGGTIVFSTQNKESMMWAMKKLMESPA